MRVVLDTNVLIAAFIARGVCNELLEHCAINHELILSNFILDELHDKLIHKFDFSSEEAEEVVRLLRSRVVEVVPQPLDKPLSRDPDDDVILGTAITGACDCIVTGDKDLLELQCVQGIEILRPSVFWALEKQCEGN